MELIVSLLKQIKENNELVEQSEVIINIEKDIDKGVEKAIKEIEYLADWAYSDLGGNEAYINILSNAIILLHNKIKEVKNG